MKKRINEIVKRLNELCRNPLIKEYVELQKELVLRQCCSTEEEYINAKNHIEELEKLDKEGNLVRKFHPDMAAIQQRIESELGNTENRDNPFSCHNAPDDGDHNPNYQEREINIKINKK